MVTSEGASFNFLNSSQKPLKTDQIETTTQLLLCQALLTWTSC